MSGVGMSRGWYVQVVAKSQGWLCEEGFGIPGVSMSRERVSPSMDTHPQTWAIYYWHYWQNVFTYLFLKSKKDP